MGRPRKVWTEGEAEQFKKLCAIFCTRAEAASILGMDVRTLDANIADTFEDTPTWDEAFEKYSAQGRASLRRKQFELAMAGDRTMLIFLGKNHLGQSDYGPREQAPRKEPATGDGRPRLVAGGSKWAGRRAANG